MFCHYRNPEPEHDGVVPSMGNSATRIRNLDTIWKNMKAVYEVYGSEFLCLFKQIYFLLIMCSIHFTIIFISLGGTLSNSTNGTGLCGNWPPS